jgi:hypothetical protein
MQFLNDIGPRQAGMVLGRKDNDGNYEPGNVRWVMPSRRFRRLKVKNIQETRPTFKLQAT